MQTLQEFMERACASEIRRGFMVDDEPDVTLLAAKVHGEVSEVFEAWRKGDAVTNLRSSIIYGDLEIRKPEGVPAELADILILVLAFCQRYQVPILDAVEEKLAYNDTRPPLNGKRV